jgi:[protein-PII] uridylyltransferase
MQHDLFHVYTVDEHTLFVLRNLRRLTVPEFYHEHPFCSDIMISLPKQELILLAALFHDIAKGRGGDHSVLGEVDAREFCQLHELSNYDTNMVAWLVRNHLLMSSTAQRKDISDPIIVHEFAQQMGDKSHLDYLYLLTVADIRGTSQDVWNDWKDALLKQLYNATRKALRRGLKNPLAQTEKIEQTRHESELLLAEHNINLADAEQLWQRFGEEYFLRHTPGEISWHSEAILKQDDPTSTTILIRDEKQLGGTAIFIYTKDRNDLFTIITASLVQLGLSIVDARILGSEDNYALDTFIVLDHEDSPVATSRFDEIYNTLEHNLVEFKISDISFSDQLTRQAKHFTFPTDISFSDDIEQERTIMEVVTYDRPGLLARVGSILSKAEIQLHNAKIATFGERAEDIFLITDKNGKMLSSDARQSIKQQLEQVLND